MKTKKRKRGLSFLLAVLVTVACLLTGCGTQKNEAREDAETIQVYLWNTTLYEKYAPYIQSQLPDVNIEFIVGNNDLDFYKFLNENGGLPDIITCCRFSLHDAAPLKDSLMNLATTNEAGAVYNTYLNSFKNEDGSVNWLPVCADAHGFVVNRSLFEKYGIPLPTDYDSFVSACQAFEKHGIRGFDADYFYDYTCMETLQGLSVSELSTAEGRKWRTAYSDPASTEKVGLDDTVWPTAFKNLEQFIRDTGLNAADLTLTYDDIMDRMRSGELAMFFSSSANVKILQDEGIDTTFLPFFGQDGQQWLMTTPYFQVALSRNLEQDSNRRDKAMQVLRVMLSEEAQNRIVYDGQDILSYSQNVSLRLTDYLEDVRPVVEQNHMYIRIASNDFFSVSKDVVSRMIAGEYTAEQAYQAFNAQLLADEPAADAAVLTSDKGYSNVFHADSGNASFSVMANTLRGRLHRENGCLYDHAERSARVSAHDERRGADRDRPRLCRGLRGRLYAVQPRLSAGGQRHRHRGQGGKRRLYADRDHAGRQTAPRGRDRNRNLSGNGGRHGAAACGREPCLRGRRHESSGHLERVCLRGECRTGGAGKLYYIEVNGNGR